MRPVPVAARRSAIAVGVALCVAGGWWWLRAPAIERHAVTSPPDVDIDPPAMRARRDAAIALATMADDPWTYAESVAASAPPDTPTRREKEDCGMAEGPQFQKAGSADQAPAETRAASPAWLATQARIDAALRASADPLDRAAADFVNAGDLRTAAGAADAVAEQAALTTDPRVFALGYAVCHGAGPHGPACAALTAERWAQIDQGNGIPWIDVLDEAHARGDDAGVRDAMAHLAVSTRFEMRLYAPAGAVIAHLPQDGRDLAAAGDLVSRAVAYAAALPFPAFKPLLDVCRDQAGGDETRARQCRAISDTMYAHADALIPFAISGALLLQTTGDASRRDLIRAERAIFAAHWSPGTGLAPCRDLREQMHQLDRKARIGAVEAMREEARKFVSP